MDIEQEYQKLLDTHKKKIHINATSCKDVAQFLFENKDKKIWWWSWEFIGKRTKDGYLSHRACARASDLALHTNLVEDRRIGRFKVYRLKVENIKEIINYIK